MQAALQRQRRRTSWRYLVPARDETTERDVDPMRLLSAEGHTYLEGWCHRAEDVRLFRLDRVVGVEVLDHAADPPAAGQPARPVRRAVPAAATTTSRPCSTWRPLRAGSPSTTRWRAPRSCPTAACGCGMRVGDEAWLRRLVLRGSGDVTVLGAAGLAQPRSSDLATSALAAYSSG